MSYGVKRFSPTEWAGYGKVAHLAAFNETLPDEDQKIDFALLGVHEGRNQAVAYMTCREVDSDSVYMKHGGVFEPFRNGVASMGVYVTLLAYLRERYKNINTLVSNENSSYLRLALSAGLKIVGIRNFKGTILVELFTEGK